MSNDESDNLENEDSVSESFGEFLKRHREASGKSLEEIAQVTRISKRYLSALENNDLDALPAPTFSRGFLRGYALEVGMNLEECLERFDRFMRATAPTQIRDIRKIKKAGLSLGEHRETQPGLWIGLVVLIFILIISGIFLWSSGSDEEVASTPEVIENSGNSEIEIEKLSDHTGQKDLVAPVPPSTLEIIAERSVSLKLRLDDKAEQEIVLQAGETKSFDVYRQVEIQETNQAGLSFRFNDKPVDETGSRIKLFNRYLFSD